MKAAILYGAEDLRLEECPEPAAGPGELVLRVGAALTCGTDLKVFRRGYHARMGKPPMPFGHEVAGTVAQVGAGVTAFREGDRVVALNSAPCDACFFCESGQQNLCDDLLFLNGAYSEYLRVPARIVAKNTLHLPDELSFEHAALTEPLACVVRGLEESQAAPGQTAVVIGAGPIGLLFVHAAAWLGLHVVAVVKRPAQAEAALALGAEHIVNLQHTSDVVSEVRALTPGARGADLALEAVATPQTWRWATEMVRKGGQVNFFGGPPAGTQVELDTNLLHYSDLTLKASFHHTPATVRRAFSMLTSGRFQAERFITARASLADVPALYRGMVTPPSGSTPRPIEIKTAIFP